MRFFAVSSSASFEPASFVRRDTSWPSDSSFLVSTSTRASRVSTSALCAAFSLSRAVCVSASFCFCASRSFSAALCTSSSMPQPLPTVATVATINAATQDSVLVIAFLLYRGGQGVPWTSR